LNRTIKAIDIATESITTAEIKNGTIDVVDIAPETITTGRIKNRTIKDIDIQTESITTREIKNGSLAGVDLADGAVTAAKLDASVVTNPATPVDACMTIAEPGSYVLRQNLSASGTCIRIAADHVTLDLAGFTLSGDGTGDGIDENDVDRSNIAVLNGTVTGFGAGIDLDFVTGAVVTMVRAFANTGNGIAVSRGIVKDSVAIGNGGVGIFSGLDSTITGNKVFDNGGTGINTGNGNVIANNSVRQNGGSGISNGAGSIVRGNAVRNNAGFGIDPNTESAVIENAASSNTGGNYDACADCVFANNSGM
jgi:hypothetical protein